MNLWHSVIAGTICLLVFYDLVCPQHMHRVPCFLLAHGTASDGGEDGGAVARTAWAPTPTAADSTMASPVTAGPQRARADQPRR